MNGGDSRCASCDIELTSDPFTLDGRTFCCQGCAQGGPCTCTYEGDLGRYPRNGHRDLLSVSELLDEGFWQGFAT